MIHTPKHTPNRVRWSFSVGRRVRPEQKVLGTRGQPVINPRKPRQIRLCLSPKHTYKHGDKPGTVWGRPACPPQESCLRLEPCAEGNPGRRRSRRSKAGKAGTILTPKPRAATRTPALLHRLALVLPEGRILKGARMKPLYHPWIPVPVQESFERIMDETLGYPRAERECAIRLVSSEAMEKFYRHPWFSRWRWSRDAYWTSWKIWFNHAIVAATAVHSARRQALDEQRERISRLSKVLEEAVNLYAEIEDAEGAAPISLPSEFSLAFALMDAAGTNSGIVGDQSRAGYELYSQELLLPIRCADGRAYFIPSVAQMMLALSLSMEALAAQLADRKTIPWSYPQDQDIFESQKANDQRAYVRHFDRNMSDLSSEFGCSRAGEPGWRLPDSLLALQCKVALDLPELDGFVDRLRKHRLRAEDL